METSIYKADIFFVVTTVAVIVFSIGFIIAIFYVIRILRDLKEFSSKARDEGEKIVDDVRLLREGMESKSVLFLHFLERVLTARREGRKMRKSR